VPEQRIDTVERILTSSDGHDRGAAVDLLPAVYTELRGLARAQLANGQTLQATALVHEAYLRLAASGRTDWPNRAYFFCAAARAMRQILVDHARRKKSLKRGGDRRRVMRQPAELAVETRADEVLAIDEALQWLEQADERKARIVMLRYFAGLSGEGTAAALGTSSRTVERKWTFARALLCSRLRQLEEGA
jgi:RNA polymerase sigma factor (TIGR02999 family)